MYICIYILAYICLCTYLKNTCFFILDFILIVVVYFSFFTFYYFSTLLHFVVVAFAAVSFVAFTVRELACIFCCCCRCHAPISERLELRKTAPMEMIQGKTSRGKQRRCGVPQMGVLASSYRLPDTNSIIFIR